MKHLGAALYLALAVRLSAQVFTDWTVVNDPAGRATGTLDGTATEFVGFAYNIGSTLDGSASSFSNPAWFVPALPLSDAIYFESSTNTRIHVINFSTPIRNPILHIQSLASRLTFSTTNITKLASDPDLFVSGARVSGALEDGAADHDANGSVRFNGLFSTISFTSLYLAPPPPQLQEDGIRFQVGGLVEPCPDLLIALVGADVVLSWLQTTNAVLERADSLTSGWQVDTNTPVMVGGNLVVTNAATGQGMFYRLRCQ